MEIYKTVRQYKTAETIIKKSRFIGHAKHVTNENEATAFIEAVKNMHAAASHNCYAYITGERNQYQKQSDDGEPSGTGGRPILEVIKNQRLQNIAIVVTRYFGGIMLGAGGLIRAYTDGAVIAIQAAEPIYRKRHQEINVKVEYSMMGKLENELHNAKVMTGDTQFLDKVTLQCWPLAAESENFILWMTNLTQGQGIISSGITKYVNHEILDK